MFEAFCFKRGLPFATTRFFARSDGRELYLEDTVEGTELPWLAEIVAMPPAADCRPKVAWSKSKATAVARRTRTRTPPRGQDGGGGRSTPRAAGQILVKAVADVVAEQVAEQTVLEGVSEGVAEQILLLKAEAERVLLKAVSEGVLPKAVAEVEVLKVVTEKILKLNKVTESMLLKAVAEGVAEGVAEQVAVQTVLEGVAEVAAATWNPRGQPQPPSSRHRSLLCGGDCCDVRRPSSVAVQRIVVM
jgi:hypothetical protein